VRSNLQDGASMHVRRGRRDPPSRGRQGYAEACWKLEESRCLHVPLMDRIDQRPRSKDELERYSRVLLNKLEGMDFRSEGLIDRVDRIIGLLERSAAD
jgi:hypothetical protein